MLLCAFGCAPDLHPIPRNAVSSEARAVALLKPIAESISWGPDGHVRSISLVGDHINEMHVSALDSLTQLEELKLMCSISDTSLRGIASLPNLQALDIQFTPVTDAGIQYLTQAPSLTLVVLTGTSLTDDGLLSLAKIRSLRRVFAEKTKITAAGVARFRELRPDCTIQHDNGLIGAE